MALIAAVLYVLAPVEMVQVPLYGLAQAASKGFPRRPAQFAFELAGIDGVASIMAWSIFDKADQLGIGASITSMLGRQFVEQRTDAVHHLQIALLIVPADGIGFADGTAHEYGQQGLHMVVDIQPVAHLKAIAIDRQRLTGQGIEDDPRDQFFRKVERPVVVGAVAEQHRQTIGALPGADQMVGRGLAGRIGRTGRIGRVLGEGGVAGGQVAVDLVGGNMVQAKGAAPGFGQVLPIGAGRLQQAVGADDIGLDKRRRPVDGTIDMGLGRQVHDRLGLEAGEHGTDPRLVGDIGLDQFVAGVGGNARQRLQVAGVGQFVEVEHLMFGVLNQLANQRRADKAGAAGH